MKPPGPFLTFLFYLGTGTLAFLIRRLCRWWRWALLASGGLVAKTDEKGEWWTWTGSAGSTAMRLKRRFRRVWGLRGETPVSLSESDSATDRGAWVARRTTLAAKQAPAGGTSSDDEGPA